MLMRPFTVLPVLILPQEKGVDLLLYSFRHLFKCVSATNQTAHRLLFFAGEMDNAQHVMRIILNQRSGISTVILSMIAWLTGNQRRSDQITVVTPGSHFP